MKIFNLMTQSTNKDGKKFYHNIGTIFQGEYNGQVTYSGYLNTNPGQKVYMFEKQPQQASNQPSQGYQQQNTQQNQQMTGPQQGNVGGINFDDPTGGSDVPF